MTTADDEIESRFIEIPVYHPEQGRPQNIRILRPEYRGSNDSRP